MTRGTRLNPTAAAMVHTPRITRHQQATDHTPRIARMTRDADLTDQNGATEIHATDHTPRITRMTRAADLTDQNGATEIQGTDHTPRIARMTRDADLTDQNGATEIQGTDHTPRIARAAHLTDQTGQEHTPDHAARTLPGFGSPAKKPTTAISEGSCRSDRAEAPRTRPPLRDRRRDLRDRLGAHRRVSGPVVRARRRRRQRFCRDDRRRARRDVDLRIPALAGYQPDATETTDRRCDPWRFDPCYPCNPWRRYFFLTPSSSSFLTITSPAVAVVGDLSMARIFPSPPM